ncbi:hypothetical protein D9M69_660120 [compost metagenome]
MEHVRDARGLASELMDGAKVRRGTGSQRMQRTSMVDSAHRLARSAEESIILVCRSISPSFRLFVQNLVSAKSEP